MKSLQNGRSASRISNSRLNYFGSLKTNEGHFKRTLAEILIERVPDTPGSKTVRDFISNEMSSLGWTVEEDPFEQDTVIGKVKFTNIIATLNPVWQLQIIILKQHTYLTTGCLKCGFLTPILNRAPWTKMLNFFF